MQKIEKWLEENGIEYKKGKYGNPYYFNDNFSVDGIQITFFWDGIGNDPETRHKLEKFMSRKRSYECHSRIFGAGITYIIMSVFDFRRWQKHEKAVSDAVEAFWQAEHARRISEAQAKAV